MIEHSPNKTKRKPSPLILTPQPDKGKHDDKLLAFHADPNTGIISGNIYGADQIFCGNVNSTEGWSLTSRPATRCQGNTTAKAGPSILHSADTHFIEGVVESLPELCPSAKKKT